MKKLGKGMFKDTARVDQPEGTMRDALNANLNIKKGSISNEWGTTEYSNNANFRVIGRAVLDDDKIVMFGQQVETVEGTVEYTDQIRLLDTRNQDVIILYENNALNFQQTHPIVTTHRKNQADEYLVYFTDGYKVEEEIYENFNYVTGYNSPRVINVTRQFEWRLDGGASNTLYNNDNSFYKLQLVPRVGSHSIFRSADIIEGGALKCAAYYLAIGYADQDGLETNYFVVSNPVYIAPGPENILPSNTFIGAEGGSPTTKAIRWFIDVPIDVDYELLQPSILKLEKTALTAVKIRPIQINPGVINIVTYSGTEDVQTIATNDIVIDNVNYITADTINQLDNRLYLGNVSSNKDIGFQPFAHNIELSTVLDTVDNFDPRLYDTFILNSGYAKMMQAYFREIGQDYRENIPIFTADDGALEGVYNLAERTIGDQYADLLNNYARDEDGITSRKGYRTPAYSFSRKTYRRGEVYAFYISFVLNDGSETYAYHIPGRAARELPFQGETNTIYETVQWYQITLTNTIIDDLGFGGNVLTLNPTQTYVFAYTTGFDSYPEGLYRIGNLDGVWGNALPNSVELTATPQPANFSSGYISNTDISLSNTELLNWVQTHGIGLAPVPNGNPLSDSYWSNITLSVLSPGTIIPSTAEVITTEENGTMFENSEMIDYSSTANFSAHGFRPGEMLDQNSTLRVYQSVDTSQFAQRSTGFWENINEQYPNTPDFALGEVALDGNPYFQGESLEGQNVRHHRMPSNLSGYPDKGFIRRVPNADKDYNEETRRTANGATARTRTTDALDSDGTLLVTEQINLLGIQLDNIRIPREILGQVQGYKIYYAKRDQKDKTILGQSLAVPGRPRYGVAPKQDLQSAVTGPFIKAFYMYGGLDHTGNETIYTLGKWKGDADQVIDDRLQQLYQANPVFKLHDFNMLRKRADLSSVTHIQCQYAVAFRKYAGGPGVFVQPCDYDKIWDAPRSFNPASSEIQATLNNEDVEIQKAHSTTFPSLGWVGPEMQNTVDFYWHDPRMADDDQYNTGGNFIKALADESRVLDISDDSDEAVETIFTGNGANFQSRDTAFDAKNKGASRANVSRKGQDLTQPSDDTGLTGTELLLAVKAKARRVRGWWTSAMIATVYIPPRVALNNRYVIKAGDYKLPFIGSSFNRWYREDNFRDNMLTLAVEPAGKILLHGKENAVLKDSTGFKGVNILFNRSGETAHAFSLVSGLPALRGFLPFFDNQSIDGAGYRPGLARWGESRNYLYPDAAIEGIPYPWLWAGSLTFTPQTEDPDDYAFNEPSTYRGLNYNLTKIAPYEGLPMAWLINVCATRTDVFNPFDKQKLVWTGYYKPIRDVNLATGAANDGSGIISNYYFGGESDQIFGGDTYISKYSFRSTSQSYGHSYFRAARELGDPVGRSIAQEGFGEDQGIANYVTGNITSKRKRFQADIPMNLNPGDNNLSQSAAGADPFSNKFGTTNGFPVWNFTARRSEEEAENNADTPFESATKAMEIIRDTRNWQQGNVNPVSTVFIFMCETDDLVGFRHIDDEERGEDSTFFDYSSANKVIFNSPNDDFTKPDKLLYGEHYSALQDLKVTSPLPVYGELAKVQNFPNRIVRSDVDSGSLADGYRKFRALEFKDIPAHRGDIRNLFDLSGNLYIHTERSLFVTKGKEELQLSAVTAFIGSGNIFVQDPDETMQADAGHAGTTSRHAHVTTSYGHFYVNYRDRKVYNVSGQGVQDITNGMETWLRENMPFVVERYGINLDSENARNNGFFVDATTGVNVPIGFTLGYDPMFKRVLITKHEPIPTQEYLEQFLAGNIQIIDDIPYFVENCSGGTTDGDDPIFRGGGTPPAATDKFVKPVGIPLCGPVWFGNPRYFTQRSWTVSYYPEMQIWGSRHSYGPNLYTNTSEFLVSFAEERSWEHTNKNNPGRFYGEVYNFEVEFIDNTAAAESKLFSNMFYWAESFLPDQGSISESFRISNPVFDEFYAYNSTQITGLPTTINYLNNARLVDRIWYVNEIRDLSVQQQLNEGELITGVPNVAGNITTQVTVHPQATTMFTEEGVVNNNYVNLNKEWYNRRKMIDHYLGVRLIKNNTNRNLVHLYAAGTKFRKSFR